MNVANVVKIFVLFFCDFCLSLDLSVQIVAPELDKGNILTTAARRATSDINKERRSPIVMDGHRVTAGVSFMEKVNSNPYRITDLFCYDVFYNNASVIMNINYGYETSTTSDYIFNTALKLGIPIISWDPVSSSSLEVSGYFFHVRI